MTDLVEKLRTQSFYEERLSLWTLLRDAADEIERLQTSCDVLNVALSSLRADAERYRELRKYLSLKDIPILFRRGVRDEPDDRSALDMAIDAAAMFFRTA